MFAVLMERYEQEMKPWVPNPERHQTTLELWRDFFEN